jgi:hypothetical protein
MNISKEQVLEIIRLADECEEKYRFTQGEPATAYSFKELIEREKTPEGIAYSNAKRMLTEYLDALEYSMLIEVETLMAYGRAYLQCDYPPTVENCFLNYKTNDNKPEGKPLAISYIAGKIPLGKYLKEALLHCNLERLSLDV